MTKKGKKKTAQEREDAPGSGSSMPFAGVTSDELLMLNQLLQLLRSGSSELKGFLGKTTANKQQSPAQSQPPLSPPQKVRMGQVSTDWVQAPSKPKKAGEQDKSQSKSTIKVLTSGNAEFVSGVGDLTTDIACFCMATMAEAKKTMAELSSDKPMAILVPAQWMAKESKFLWS